MVTLVVLLLFAACCDVELRICDCDSCTFCMVDDIGV